MIIIIPIGGVGQRFKDNGYNKPKALINIFGKPILYYLLDNLNLDQIDYVCIPYNKEYLSFNFENNLIKNYPNIKFKFLILKNNTRGAAETLNIFLNTLNKIDKPILCLDSDNFYYCDIINKWKGENMIFTIEDKNKSPIYSYVKCNNNIILDIKEKDKISDNACTGAYGFKSFLDLKKYTSKIIENNITQKSEFYTSGVIKEMIKDNHTFYNKNIKIDDFICLGTPVQLKTFYNNFPKISCKNNKTLIKPLRICFDLDNILFLNPKIKNDYSSVEPIQKNINFLKYLKKFNNTIIIYTKREINNNLGKITFDTLEKFKIPYDEIYFGKPNADYYIDYDSINNFNNLDKELGFYDTNIETRYFNNIETKSINIIIKKGDDLSGEIYYYKNIPDELKDLFPLFFYSEENTYHIEKINGLTLTDLYLSELLTENTLKHVLNSIKRLQNTSIENTSIENTPIENTPINIYNNYANKLKIRYENYNYSIFKNNKNIYDSLMKKLLEYEKNNKGIKKIIHGDPVFTNIIINNFDKIKFIDMRGKIGNTLTIYGDWLYDWAKIYQSLIGYDEILMSKNISEIYKDKMINIFKEYFIENYSEVDFINLQIITKSLLFTLIPLHKNDKCKLYFDLIDCKYL